MPGPTAWVHAFVDVPAADTGTAQASCSAATGRPPGDPWPGPPGSVALADPVGLPSCVARDDPDR